MRHSESDVYFVKSSTAAAGSKEFAPRATHVMRFCDEPSTKYVIRVSAFFVYSVNSVVENDSRLAPCIKKPDGVFRRANFALVV